MSKKNLLISFIAGILTGLTISAVIFFLLYKPNQPPKKDNVIANKIPNQPSETPKTDYVILTKQKKQNILDVVDVNNKSDIIADIIDANNRFAFDLYSQLSKSEKGNIFYSPYSILSAIAMIYEGSKGQTAKEIKSVFHLPESNILSSNFSKIYNDINKAANDYELKTVNTLWIQQDFSILPDYTNRIENYYGGKAINLDFFRENEKSRQTINSYIEEQTNYKIKDLIPFGYISQMTRLVLTNAIYFKGTWRWEFTASKTRIDNFMIAPNNIVKVPMMYMDPKKATFNYAQIEGGQILELPYKGDKISMLIILPSNNLASIESSLTVEKLREYKSKMKETKLDLIILPKFELNSKYSLQDNLSALGMPTAFSANADFSGITGKKDLTISYVIHQAYVMVNEEGTEAATASAIGVIMRSARPGNNFIADHPFLFLIQEKETGNILFLGRLIQPN